PLLLRLWASLALLVSEGITPFQSPQRFRKGNPRRKYGCRLDLSRAAPLRVTVQHLARDLLIPRQLPTFCARWGTEPRSGRSVSLRFDCGSASRRFPIRNVMGILAVRSALAMGEVVQRAGRLFS